MSANTLFTNEPSTLEIYNPSVTRTISSKFTLPRTREDLYFQSDFFTYKNYNNFVNYVFDNLNYMDGYSVLYNSLLPIETGVCNEYNQEGKIGICKNDTYEVTFSSSEIYVYVNGILDQIISETNFGSFRDIHDVIVIDSTLILIDGNHILKLDISTNPATFVTFFGGYGGIDSEYKFQNPSKIIYNNDRIYVWDQGNTNIKIYDKGFNYIETVILSNIVLDISVNNLNEIFILTNDLVTNLATGHNINHGVETPLGLELDTTQYGFLWVYNDVVISKFTEGGLGVGDYDIFDSIIDIVRDGTKLHVISDNTWNSNLDFSFTETIKEGFEFPNKESNVYLMPDEFVDDWIINNTYNKIYNNINQFNLALTGNFLVSRNNNSTIQNVEVLPTSSVGLDVDCNLFVAQDEIVACNVLNRNVDEIYDLMLRTGDRLLGNDVFILENNLSSITEQELIPINWSLGAQSCEGVEPQLFNSNFTPLSFIELENPILECNPLTGGCLSA